MKIGYPCINWAIGCKGDRTFRLKSYSEERLVTTVQNNLDCLYAMLRFNVDNDILFFRITSDLIPFASHPVCQFDWLSYFDEEFAAIGSYIISHNIRISMHPGQFTILNTPDARVLENSVKELEYHAQVLDAMGLDNSAKIQLHVGGVYGNKEESPSRFVRCYNGLHDRIKRRLVIENDDRHYSIKDCLRVHAETQVPILFDSLHHELNNAGESVKDALTVLAATWARGDGIPMVDYSHLRNSGRQARHAESIDIQHFTHFVAQTSPFDFDLMLEIKDKEESALKAVEAAKADVRFFKREGQDT
jgi:UV DNA damage endonuclease